MVYYLCTETFLYIYCSLLLEAHKEWLQEYKAQLTPHLLSGRWLLFCLHNTKVSSVKGNSFYSTFNATQQSFSCFAKDILPRNLNHKVQPSTISLISFAPKCHDKKHRPHLEMFGVHYMRITNDFQESHVESDIFQLELFYQLR